MIRMIPKRIFLTSLIITLITAPALPASADDSFSQPLVGIGAGAADLAGAGTIEQETETWEKAEVQILGAHSTLTVEGTLDEYEWIETNLAWQFMDYVIPHAEGNPNVIHYLYEWGHDVTSPETFSYTDEEREADIPLLMQWDWRWGFNYYGGGPTGLTACAPTCMAMIGFGLTKDESITPQSMCEYSADSGYWVSGSGTSWSLVENAFPNHAITSMRISADEATIKSELAQGHPVLINVGAGKFSAVGHFMVLAGTNDDGTFILNDPNNLENCNKAWAWSDLASEVQAAWSYSYTA